MKLSRKEKNRMKFIRSGGTRKLHRSRPNHAHAGSGCDHKSSPGWNKMDEKQRALHLKRLAVRQGGLVEEE